MHCSVICAFLLSIFLNVNEGCVSVKELKIGSNNFITCKYDGIDNTYPMYWAHDGKIISWLNSATDIIDYSPDLYSVSIDSLRFKTVKGFTTAGVYGCFFPFQKSCSSGSATLDILLSPEQLSTTIGQTISLDCFYGDSDISWFRNNNLISFHGDILLHNNTMISTTGSRLIIKNIRDVDSGYYECRQARYLLNKFEVSVDGSIKSDGITYHNDSPNVTVTQTDEEIRFKVDKLASFENLYILKGNMVVYRNTPNWFLEASRWIGRIEGFTSISYIFEIKRKTQYDSGNYSFVVIKDNHTSKTTVEVSVPTENLYARRNENANLTCRSYNSGVVYWKKGGKLVSIRNSNLGNGLIPSENGMVLLVKNVSKLSEGVYECWRKYKLWSISLRIQDVFETTSTTTISTTVTTSTLSTMTSSSSKIQSTPIITTKEAITMPATTKTSEEKDYTDVYIALGAVGGVILLAIVAMAAIFAYCKRRLRVADTEMQYYHS